MPKTAGLVISDKSTDILSAFLTKCRFWPLVNDGDCLIDNRLDLGESKGLYNVLESLRSKGHERESGRFDPVSMGDFVCQFRNAIYGKWLRDYPVNSGGFLLA